jgi:glycine cleavage system H protein
MKTAVAGETDGRRGLPPAGLRFHTGHTWVRLVSVDLALVGATDFAVSFAGGLAEISLPHEFSLLRPGDTAWTLCTSRGRCLSQVSPIGGQILAVNSDVREDPTVLNRSPYHTGWVLCVRSPSIPYHMRNLLSHEPDLLGLERTFRRMNSVLGTALRLPYADGKWKPGFGDDLNDEEWEALRRDLFPSASPPLVSREVGS